MKDCIKAKEPTQDEITAKDRARIQKLQLTNDCLVAEKKALALELHALKQKLAQND